MVTASDPAVLPLVIVCLLLVVAVIWLALRGRRGEDPAVLWERAAAQDAALARLEALAGQGEASRRAEAEMQGRRLVELERALFARLEQARVETGDRLGAIATTLAREQGESRVAMQTALRAMSEHNAERLAAIQASVNEQLHAAVEKQMQSSFQRVLDGFTAIQKAVGEVGAVTAQIGDLKRLFSNVKTRGGWGEAQLRAILDDVLPQGAYATNVRLSETSADVVEFAVRMPMRGAARPFLAIDSKFPTEAYERLLDAVETIDAEGERAARRALESNLRMEARKIASKYIVPPMTVEFAVLYLPTDGLYAEAARIPGLIDSLGREHKVLVMGPSLIPALLRTVHLGYVTLAMEEKAEAIGQLLGATRQEMVRMDQVLEKLARNASAMGNAIEEARRRTRVVGRKLRGVEAVDADVLGLEDVADPVALPDARPEALPGE